MKKIIIILLVFLSYYSFAAEYNPVVLPTITATNNVWTSNCVFGTKLTLNLVNLVLNEGDYITWDFGDGTTNTSDFYPAGNCPSCNPFEVLHVYSNAGTYTVTATVHILTAGGYTDSPIVTSSVVVSYVQQFAPLVANFTQTNTGLDTYEFKNGSSTISNYLFEYGDGTTYNVSPLAPNSLFGAAHAYTVPGLIIPRLTLYRSYNDFIGCSVTESKRIIVRDYCSYLSPFLMSDNVNSSEFYFHVSTYSEPNTTVASIVVNYGDGSSATNVQQGQVLQHSYSDAIDYTVTQTVTLSNGVVCNQTIVVSNAKACCSNFNPIVGKTYWLSAWVKEDIGQVKNYSNGIIKLGFVSTTSTPTVSFNATGEIIDGWQRIAGEFIVPSGTTDLEINLINNNANADVYFDDVRIHPFNASMKSYVYDPITLLLSAELDDNNYATIYEYDNEGQLIRIKKETERGIMTIQESRSNNPKSN